MSSNLTLSAIPQSKTVSKRLCRSIGIVVSGGNPHSLSNNRTLVVQHRPWRAMFRWWVVWWVHARLPDFSPPLELSMARATKPLTVRKVETTRT